MFWTLYNCQINTWINIQIEVLHSDRNYGRGEGIEGRGVFRNYYKRHMHKIKGEGGGRGGSGFGWGGVEGWGENEDNSN